MNQNRVFISSERDSLIFHINKQAQLYSKIDDLSFLHLNIEVYLSHLTPMGIVNPLKVDSKCKLHYANELFKEKKTNQLLYRNFTCRITPNFDAKKYDVMEQTIFLINYPLLKTMNIYPHRIQHFDVYLKLIFTIYEKQARLGLKY